MAVRELGYTETQLAEFANDTAIIESPTAAQARAVISRAATAGAQATASLVPVYSGAEALGAEVDSVIADRQGLAAQGEGEIHFLEGEGMSFDGAKIVRTERDNEMKIIVVDGGSGTSADRKLRIAQVGDAFTAGVNDQGVVIAVQDASGNAAIPTLGAGGGLNTQLVDDAGDKLGINADGSINVKLEEPVGVEATDLDIRDLSHTQDSVKVGDGTNLMGVTAGGAAKVEVQNTVTVEATDLDIRNLDKAQDSVSAEISNTVTVESTDLDIRDLSHTQDSMKIGDGTDFLGINPDGSINAKIVSAATPVCHPAQTLNVAINGTHTHDYVVPNGETFTGEDVLVGCRGQAYVEVGIWDGSAFTPSLRWYQDPKENGQKSIKKLKLVGDGTKAIRVVATNKDGGVNEISTTIQGERAA